VRRATDAYLAEWDRSMNEAIAIALGALVLAVLHWAAKAFPGAQRRARQSYLRRLMAEQRRGGSGGAVEAERAFLKRCSHCRVFAVTLPYRDKLGRTYCSEPCMRWWSEGPRSFCGKCMFETIPETPTLFSFHAIGMTLIGRAEPCGACGSVVRRLWLTVLFLPLIPLGRYRVIQVSPETCLSRRVGGLRLQ
jgi:hypothetical protein